MEAPRDTWKDVIVAALDHVQYPFHCLLMLMCSGRVTDRILKQEFQKLFDKFNHLSPQDVLDMSVSEFDSYLGHIGMAKTRTAYIMATCHTIIEDFHGVVPNSVIGLLTLQGVGPKVAHILMKVFGKSPGVGIDYHLRRIFFRLGWSITDDTSKSEILSR